jgi:hypothetical protein
MLLVFGTGCALAAVSVFFGTRTARLARIEGKF